MEYYQNNSISDKEQGQYDAAAHRLNRYWAISSGGTYDSEEADAIGQQSQDAFSALYDSCETLAEKGATKEQIMERARPVLEKLGIDEDAFDATVDWEKLGRRPGGVQ